MPPKPQAPTLTPSQAVKLGVRLLSFVMFSIDAIANPNKYGRCGDVVDDSMEAADRLMSSL